MLSFFLVPGLDLVWYVAITVSSFFVLLSGLNLVTVTWQLLHGSNYALLFHGIRSGSGLVCGNYYILFFVLLSGLNLVTVMGQ
jgi:hypothetical protein